MNVEQAGRPWRLIVPFHTFHGWSCAFLGSRTPSMLCRLNRHWPVGLNSLQLRHAPHIALLPEGFDLDPPATSQLYQPASAEGRLQRDLLQRLRPPQCQKVSLLALFLLHTLANPPPARPTSLLQPIVASCTPVGAHPALSCR